MIVNIRTSLLAGIVCCLSVSDADAQIRLFRGRSACAPAPSNCVVVCPTVQPTCSAPAAVGYSGTIGSAVTEGVRTTWRCVYTFTCPGDSITKYMISGTSQISEQDAKNTARESAEAVVCADTVGTYDCEVIPEIAHTNSSAAISPTGSSRIPNRIVYVARYIVCYCDRMGHVQHRTLIGIGNCPCDAVQEAQRLIRFIHANASRMLCCRHISTCYREMP